MRHSAALDSEYVRWVPSHPSEILHNRFGRLALSSWKTLLCRRDAPTDIDALTWTALATYYAIAGAGVESIDLAPVSNAGVSGEHLAMVLRVTSSQRDLVPGWHQALLVAEMSLARAGLDAEDVLYGLV